MAEIISLDEHRRSKEPVWGTSIVGVLAEKNRELDNFYRMMVNEYPLATNLLRERAIARTLTDTEQGE